MHGTSSSQMVCVQIFQFISRIIFSTYHIEMLLLNMQLSITMELSLHSGHQLSLCVFLISGILSLIWFLFHTPPQSFWLYFSILRKCFIVVIIFIQVYFMDNQIFYAIFSTLYGGFIGAFDRLGEVQNQFIMFLLNFLIYFDCSDFTMFSPSYLVKKSEFLLTIFLT